MRFFKNKKGIFGLDDFLALTAISALLVLIPFFTLKYHVNNVLQFENKYNTADLAMLALISMKSDGSDMPTLLGGHFIYNSPSDLSFLKKYLDDFVPSKCYELQTPDASNTVTSTSETQTQISTAPYSLLIKSTVSDNSCTPDSTSTVNIVLPYNPQKLTQKLELRIS